MEMKFPKGGSPHARSNIRDFLGRSFRGEIKNGRVFFFFFMEEINAYYPSASGNFYDAFACKHACGRASAYLNTN